MDNVASIQLAPLDLAIVGGYFALVVIIGLLLSRAAAKGIDDYFLGGRRIPWWVLGASGSASNFDMTGTMVITSFLFAMGLQGFWVALRGGMVLSLAVLLAFMARWLRRSKVVTTAEWMELRFGSGPGGKLARGISAVANITLVIGLIIYFTKGTGAFLAIFLPFSPGVCAIGMVSVAMVYTVLSGLYGVVYTDLFQELMLIIAAGYIVLKAAFLPEHAAVLEAAGPSWTTFSPNWIAEPMHWLGNPDVYHMFGVCIIFWIARNLLNGFGGLSGGYMAQRFYAAPDSRSAALMTAEWMGLLSLRWAMVAGVAVLGLQLAGQDAGVAAQLHADPEQTLPIVLGRVLPQGFLGIAVAGLIAAAMSTFDSTLNAGASYWVRDVYQRFIRPDADRRQLMRQSYLATVLIAATGVSLAFGVKNINEIWNWITGPLSAGVSVPLVLRWYWHRFNGYGFAAGTSAGLLTAIILAVFAPDMAFYLSFPLTALVSASAGVIGSLISQPVDRATLERFFLQIRPFGAWGDIPSVLSAEDRTEHRRVSRRDLSNVGFALVMQVSLFATAVTMVTHQWSVMAFTLMTTLALAVVLYFRWYKKLPPPGVD